MKLYEKLISVLLVTTIALATTNTVFALEPCKTYESLKKEVAKTSLKEKKSIVKSVKKSKKKKKQETDPSIDTMDTDALLQLLLNSFEFEDSDFDDCTCTFENILPHIPKYVQQYISKAHMHDLDKYFAESTESFTTGNIIDGRKKMMEFNNLVSKYESLAMRYESFDTKYIPKLNNPTNDQIEELRGLFLESLKNEVSKSSKLEQSWENFDKLYNKIKKVKYSKPKDDIVKPSRKIPKPDNHK